MYDDDIDNVIGIVHVKDVLAAITGDSPPVSIRQVKIQTAKGKDVGLLGHDFWRRAAISISLSCTR